MVRAVGPFTMRPNPDLFTVLVHTVIAQQISVKAADSIGRRLTAAAGRSGLTPKAIAKLSDDDLRAAGLSGSKQRSMRHLAARFGDGSLDPTHLAGLDDVAVAAQLRAVPGIGPWSVDMVLIFGLGRPDILPVGDYGLRAGVKDQFGLAALPGAAEMQEIAEPWRPYRTVATWYFWRSRGGVPQSA